MPQIVDPTNFSPNNLTVPDVYLIVQPPQAYIAGLPSSVIGGVGTASWGPLNKPLLVGDTNTLNSYFGTVSAAALTDIHDLATDITQALNQAGQPGLSAWCVRVSNGSDAKATVTLVDTTGSPITGGALNGLFSGILGNQIKCTISAAVVTGLVNVLLTGWQGKRQEFYTNLPQTSAFWAALASALATGQGPTVAPSQLCRFVPAGSGSPQAPALGTFTLAGGNDGRSGLTTSQQLGSNAGAQPTGIYALAASLSPPVTIAWLVGNTDSTAYSAITQFGAQNGIAVMLGFPIDTSVSDGVTALNTAGIVHWEAIPVLDWLLIFDTLNGATRFISPMGTVAGRLAVLAPQNSAVNKTIGGIIGTSRTNVNSPNAPYSNAEIGQAEINGITLISNPIPLGNTFGFRTGVNAAARISPVQGPIEYTRMTNFLISSIGAALGQFVGQPLSHKQDDPTMAAVRQALNGFLGNLVAAVQLENYVTICDLTNNSAQTVAQHELFVSVNAKYLSSVLFLIFQLQGGTTVNLLSAVITGGQPI